jgi:hypothetical protein
MVKEWDVFFKNHWLGTVHESSEDSARNAAWSKYSDELKEAEIEDLSVRPRS